MKKSLGILLVAMLLSSCSAMRKGYYQKLAVTTEPTKATCKLTAPSGAVISSVVSDGTFYNVRRTHRDLVLTCSKKGYLDTQTTLSPTTDKSAVSITAPLDALVGTNMLYPTEVHLTLRRN